MEIDTQQIIDMLKNRGDHDKAQKAQADLSDKVDTDQHADKLKKLGVDLLDLVGGAGSLGGKLDLSLTNNCPHRMGRAVAGAHPSRGHRYLGIREGGDTCRV